MSRGTHKLSHYIQKFKDLHPQLAFILVTGDSSLSFWVLIVYIRNWVVDKQLVDMDKQSLNFNSPSFSLVSNCLKKPSLRQE